MRVRAAAYDIRLLSNENEVRGNRISVFCYVTCGQKTHKSNFKFSPVASNLFSLAILYYCNHPLF